ncbi:HGxxPAAW family protein [Georgenia sp. Z1491]|uniref:HGxxPAAW family protein n=1 Tax=Georgenia sp. Z1491 TaxID=3416707 RepID=UPI003CF6FC22
MTGTSLEQHQTGYRLPVAAPPHNEGKTVAGWAVMIIVSLGVLVSCAGLVVDAPVIMWVAGPVVAVVGLVVGLVLRLTGRGQERRTAPARDWYESPEQERSAGGRERAAGADARTIEEEARTR